MLNNRLLPGGVLDVKRRRWNDDDEGSAKTDVLV